MITHEMLVDDLTCHGPCTACDDYDDCRDCCEHSVTEYEDSIRKEAIRKFVEWLVNKGVLGDRVIANGEITDYGKFYVSEYEQEQKHDNT